MRAPHDAGRDPAPGDALRRVVEEHAPEGTREIVAKARILRELDRLPRPCDESADPVHVTGSAVVVGARGMVMHLHRRLGRWMQPGGHVDGGEEPWQAAERESEEETGLAVAHPPGGPILVHLDVHPAAQGHTHLDLRYLLLAEDAEPAPPPGESQDVRWCTWDEAASMADEALVGAIALSRALWAQHGPAWLATAPVRSGPDGPDRAR
ncbi:MAG TPA: NUDIX domain-containing protein [Acidimicrobiales bacterium]|nr:NUDIX domain-containing protein [Acidimicrobiales bacterium]